MAAAKKCDRCSVFYEKNTQFPIVLYSGKTVIDGMSFTTRNNCYTQHYDLCD